MGSFADERMTDRRNQVAPPLRAIAEQIATGERIRRRIDDDVAGRVPDVRHPGRGDEHQAPGGDKQRAHRSCACPVLDQPIRRHGDRGDDGRDQPAIKVRERDGQRRDAKKADRWQRGVVEASPQRKQIQRDPMCLCDVGVISRVRHMEWRERVGHRSDSRSRPQ